jgi:hypothetical protein
VLHEEQAFYGGYMYNVDGPRWVLSSEACRIRGTIRSVLLAFRGKHRSELFNMAGLDPKEIRQPVSGPNLAGNWCGIWPQQPGDVRQFLLFAPHIVL